MTTPVAADPHFRWVEVRSAGAEPARSKVEKLAVRLDEPPGGAACAVLYFHGFGADQGGEKANYFRAQAVASGLAFCSFDFRGHGRSEGDLRGLTLSRNLADAWAVRQFLASRGYEKVVLFGSSMGGATALWHGARHPEGLVAGYFVAPALTMADAFVSFLGDEGARQWERQGFFVFEDSERSCELGWQLVEDFRRYDRRQLSQLYRVPSLIFQGKLDDRVPWRMMREFVDHSHHNGLLLHLYDDGDHRLVDRVELLWELTVAHLRELGLL